jgi:hypothetical protein
MTFEELCKLDDRLLAIYQEAGAFRCLNETGEPVRTFSAERAAKLRKDPAFCKQQLWRGVPGQRGEVGLLDQMKQCVGWTAAVPELANGDTYDVAYRAVERNLMGCGHDGECYLYDYPAPKDIQPCGNCGSSVLGRDVKDTPQMTSWTCQCGARRESLKRNNPSGFGSILDRLKHKAAEMEAKENGTPPPAPLQLIDENTIVPDDKAEPVYIVGSEEDAHKLAFMLRIKERFDAGEITKWYARNCIYFCDPASRKILLSTKLNKDNVTGPLGWKPVVLTFADPELERKLAEVCVQVVTVIPTRKGSSDVATIELEEVRAAVKEIKAAAKLETDDMPLAVLDGWLGEVCRTRMLEDFPLAYAWPALLTAASVLVTSELLPGARGGFETRANIYTGLIGPVQSGKSSVLSTAFYLLDIKDPVLMHLKAGSAEGMAEIIGNANGNSRLVFVEELEHLMKKVNYEGSTFANFLNDAYYRDQQTLVVARRKQVAFNARLTLAGGIPEQGFEEVFGAGSVTGLHSRFVFGVCPSKFEGYVYHPPEGEPALQNIPEDHPDFAFQDKRPHAITIDASVWKETARWQKDLKLSGRSIEAAMRAAYICAAFDCRGTLTAANLGPALAFAQYQESVHKRFQPNPGKNGEAIVGEATMRYLRDHGADGGWLNRRTMLAAIGAYHYGAATVNRALEALQRAGELELTKAGRQLLVRLALDRM